MQSLNSFQYDRDKITNPQVETTMTKQNIQIESETSLCLLNNKKVEIQSPDIGSNIIFKPFAKLILYFHIASFVIRFQRYFKPDGSFMDKHFSIIGDKGSGNSKDFLAFKSKKPSLTVVNFESISWKVHIPYLYRQYKRKLEFLAIKCFNQIPLIEPTNKIKMIWDILLNLIRIELLYLIPILITYEKLLDQYHIILIIASFCFLIDMGLKNITIYFDQGLPIRDRYQILHNQNMFFCLIEFSGLMGMFIFALFYNFYDDVFILNGGYLKLVLLLVFYQIKNILVFIDNLSQSMSFGKATSAIIELTRLLGIQLILQHLSSCLWIIIGRYCLQNGIKNWIEISQLTESSWDDIYIESLYFISISMFTVGYGDVHPNNKIEKIFSIFFVFLCAFQLSYSLDTIGHLLQQLKKTSEQINKKLTFINQYMHNKNISKELQVQVREYLQYFWYQEQTKQTLQQQKILNQLSDDLRRSLAYESNILVFKKCKLLSQEFSQKFQNDILKQLSFSNYQPSIQINTHIDGEFFLHIIESGKVNVYEKNEKDNHLTLMGTHKEGECFNLEQFLKQEKQDRLVYKSAGFVSTLVIPFSLFYQTLKDYQNDLEKYQDIKNQIQQSQIQLKQCVSCDSRRHQSDLCRQVHYIPDREKVLKSYIYNQCQERQFFVRNRNRLKNYFSAKVDIEFLKEAANLVKVSNESHAFLKFQDLEEINNDESKPHLKIKHDADSISLLIKEFESKSYIPDGNSELKLQQSCSRSRGLNQEEFNVIQSINQKLRNKQLFTSHDIEQMEFTIKKLELNYNHQIIQDFEKLKEYKIYNVHHNVSQVLKFQNYPIRKLQYNNSNSYETCQLSQASYLLKYLLYPFDFINQYRVSNLNGMKRSEKISKVQQRQRRMSKELLLKRIGRKLIFRKALQIHPAK
ncbi:unnamed protein product [Paramecium pentaurelia]|uniref:Cyclic nucleotide-binding domain-containing protein n=1 Tax=Paramecium pentaurelia TaxID=43138 RepID=A0A8S1T9D1_9CILI|nr:unnamed protein product [Paramecium pentaurelia]